VSSQSFSCVRRTRDSIAVTILSCSDNIVFVLVPDSWDENDVNHYRVCFKVDEADPNSKLHADNN
jgi:hypothetical protein